MRPVADRQRADSKKFNTAFTPIKGTFPMMMRQVLAPLLLAAFVSSTSAAPVTLHLMGSWETASSDQNLSVSITVDSEAPDQDTGDLIGAYRITDITFKFEQLAQFASPFSLIGDAARSTLHLYPSSPGSPMGEVRAFGQFTSGSVFPSGVLPIEYDLRLTFTTLDDDDLGSLATVGPLVSSTFYLADQVGARSSGINQPAVSVNFAVPEPDAGALLVTALGATAWARRRIR